MPDWLGRPGAKGAPSRPARPFSEGQEWIVCAVPKGEAANLREKPKPTGLELPSAGITLKPSSNERHMKGRLACTTASDSVYWPKMLMGCPLHPTAVVSRSSPNKLGWDEHWTSHLLRINRTHLQRDDNPSEMDRFSDRTAARNGNPK
jgi:hypothetical protein